MKNILQIENNFVKKYLTNDNILKIVALVSALLIFFAVNGEGTSFAEYFSSSITIEDVPLEVNYNDDFVVTGLPESINVIVSGPDANIESAKTKQDLLKASLDLNVSEEGSRTIDANEISFTSIGDVTIAPIIKNYDIEVQNKISKDMPIAVNYVNAGDLTEGLMLEDPSLSEDFVTITGGSQDVSKIEEVKAIVDLSQLNGTDKNSVKIEAKLNAYDDKGEIVKNINMSTDTISVTQKFTVNSVTLPVNYTFTNKPTDQYVSAVCDKEDVQSCVASDGSQYKATVAVFGNKDKIEQMTSGVEYRINLANMNLNNNQVEATAVLPEGVYTQTQTQLVTITMEEGVTKTISDVSIGYENLDDGLVAKTVDSKDAFIDVKVTGAKSTLDQIDGNNLQLTVDLDGYKAGDIATVPLRIEVADYVTAEPAQETVEMEISEE